MTHVIVDKLHERRIESDVLMMLLRDAIARRPDLIVVMMSVTANIELFSGFFNKIWTTLAVGRPVPSSPSQARRSRSTLCLWRMRSSA